MFSNKGNINKSSSGNNYVTGDNNTIKNESNNTNNYYGIPWKIITLILPSSKHSNTHNIIIGWLSILVNIVLIIVTIVSINNTFKPSESSKYSPNSLGTSPTATLSDSTTSSSSSISATYSASSLPSVQTVSPLPSNSLSSKTQDSPAPATRPEGSPSNKITIEVSDNPHSGKKLAPGKYQISGSGYAEISTWWTSISYNNTVSSNDCEIVLTVEGPAPVKGETRTAKCTDSSGTDLTFSEPGDYTINIEDKQSGTKSSRVIQIVK